MKSHQTLHCVVANIEDVFTVWPASHAPLPGWRDTGKVGSREECLAYIQAVERETDPDTLRRLLEQDKRRP